MRTKAQEEIKDNKEYNKFMVESFKRQEEDKFRITTAFQKLRTAIEEKEAAKRIRAEEKRIRGIEKERKADKRRVKALYKNIDDFIQKGVLTADE